MWVWATHEPNFTIIREEFKPNKPRPCALCGQMGHEIKDCQGLAREKQGEVIDSSSPSSTQSFTSTPCMNFCFVFSLSAWWIADTVPVSEQEFIFIRLIVLREVCSILKKWFTQKEICSAWGIQDIYKFVFPDLEKFSMTSLAHQWILCS